jgi:hypothetical protein
MTTSDKFVLLSRARQERSSIARSKKERDPIPEHFKSVEETAEFWDSDDLADYWDLAREADFDVDI